MYIKQHTSLYAQHHWYGRNPKDKDLLYLQFLGDYLPQNLGLRGRSWCDGVECWGAHGWIPSEMNREWGARIYFHRLLRRMKTKPNWPLKKKKMFRTEKCLGSVGWNFLESSLLFPTFDFGCFFSSAFVWVHQIPVGWTSKMASQKVDGIWVNDLGMHQKKENAAVFSPVRNAKLAVALVFWVWVGVKWCFVQFMFTPWKINIEPTNHPFRKEEWSEPNLHDYTSYSR